MTAVVNHEQAKEIVVQCLLCPNPAIKCIKGLTDPTGAVLKQFCYEHEVKWHKMHNGVQIP